VADFDGVKSRRLATLSKRRIGINTADRRRGAALGTEETSMGESAHQRDHQGARRAGTI